MIKDFIKTHLTVVCFFVFVILSLIVLTCFQTKALKDLKQRNERILAHYEQVLSVDSAEKEMCDMDFSLYVKDFKLTPAQSLAFQDYTKRVIENAVAQSQIDNEVSSLVEAKAATMYQETKDLLEMQFAKIQHETESLQIWCGILTVVFLIFSFYSLFKTDELVQQGRDGVKELSLLQDRGKESIEIMKQNGQAKIDAFEVSSKEVIKKASMNMSEEKKKILDAFNEKEGKAITTIDQKISEANTMLDKKYQDLASALDDKNRDITESRTNVYIDFLQQLNSRLDVLGLRIEALERSR